MRRLKVGVVGAGIGASHIEAYQALPEMYEVTALCDIVAERAAAVCTRLDVPTKVGSLDALLEHDLDIVDICTPSGLHQPQALAALAAGFHVVVEKPVARSLAEVDAIAAAEAAGPGRVCPIFQYRFGDGVRSSST
jgi:predicted dehydrogenase